MLCFLFVVCDMELYVLVYSECFVVHMLYVCVLCASCGSSQCCVLHDLLFVKAGRGCNRHTPESVS